jgi:hypothetical protein
MASTLEYRLTGGASNADPNKSLGGTMSSEKLSTTPLNDLFANVLPEDRQSEDSVRYRAFDIQNTSDVMSQAMEFYFLDTPNSESIVAIWLDSTGTQEIADEQTAPVGATFTTPLIDSKLSLPNLAAGSNHRLWIRRTVDQDADTLNDDLAEIHLLAT